MGPLIWALDAGMITPFGNEVAGVDWLSGPAQAIVGTALAVRGSDNVGDAFVRRNAWRDATVGFDAVGAPAAETEEAELAEAHELDDEAEDALSAEALLELEADEDSAVEAAAAGTIPESVDPPHAVTMTEPADTPASRRKARRAGLISSFAMAPPRDR